MNQELIDDYGELDEIIIGDWTFYRIWKNYPYKAWHNDCEQLILYHDEECPQCLTKIPDWVKLISLMEDKLRI